MEQQKKGIGFIITIVALIMSIYHILFAMFVFQEATLNLNAHLGFALLLVFLMHLQESRTKLTFISNLLFLIFTITSTVYIFIFHDALKLRGWFNTPFDLTIGLILLFLVIEGTRRSYGIMIPVLSIMFVAYPFIGTHLPEPFYTTSYGFWRTISSLSVSLDGGIYGVATSISATYIFLFMLFGGILEATGAVNFFFILANIIGRRFRGGPALMAVISSAGIGSITGSVAANVAVTGAYTIPLMKKVGYSPEQAAAIEAAASTGGQILPPIMGVVAFAMAGFTGIPYLRICLMALIPAILYFLSVGFYVQLQAVRLNLKPLSKKDFDIDIMEMIFSMLQFIFTIGVIIYLLITGYSIMKVAIGGIISAIAASMVRKESRPSLSRLIDGFVKGAKSGATLAAMSACIGLILSTITMTGVGIKLTAGIESWSGGSIIIAMVMVVFVSILLGMGGASMTSYFIVAIFSAPALIKMGLPLEMAHFLVMYPAIFSYLTPPVAIGSLVASNLANSNYWRTCIEGMKAGGVGILFPFLIIFCPVLLLQQQVVADGCLEILACLLIIFLFQVFIAGFFIKKCSLNERLIVLFSMLLIFLWLPKKNHIFFIMATIIFLSLFIYQIIMKRRETLMIQTQKGRGLNHP